MPDPAPRLLLDEDVWQGLAAALREAGYDAVSATEEGYKGLSDEEILFAATTADRAVVSHNIQDFAHWRRPTFFKAVPMPGSLSRGSLRRVNYCAVSWPCLKPSLRSRWRTRCAFSEEW
jgi:hypothetical protein